MRQGECCQLWALHLPWLNFDSRVISLQVLAVVTKVIVVVETRGCRGANKVSVGVSDDVLHDLVVGNKVGRVPDELGVILPACPLEGWSEGLQYWLRVVACGCVRIHACVW